jgi:DNA repair exonuclease SbcCD ATPase subunit
MIKFKHLKVKDFMSLGDVDYEFKPKMGLLLGINEDSTGADDNGAGKSSMIEALRWCLYDETVRAAIDKSLSKDHVIRKGCKRASVTLHVDAGGIPLIITRTRSKNKGTLSVEHGGSPHTGKAAQEVLATALGIDVVQFSNLVHLDGSYPRLFAPSTDKDRKEILSDLVDVGVAQQMQEEAKRRLKPVEDALREKSSATGTLKLQIQMAKEDIEKAQWLVKDYKKQRDDDKKNLEPVKELAETLETQKDWLEEQEVILTNKGVGATKKQEDELSKADGNIDKLRTRLDLQKDSYLVEKVDILTKQLNYAETQADVCRTRVNEMEALQARGKCPECGQDTTHVGTADIESLTSQAEGHDREFQKLETTLKDTKQRRADKLADIKRDLREQEQYRRAIKEDLNTISRQGQTERKEIRDQLKKVTAEWTTANRKYTKLAASQDKYTELIKEARTRASQGRSKKAMLEEKLEDVVTAYNNLLQQQAALEFWKKGFGPKGVPSLYIETVLPSISSRIQEYANILTGGDVIVTLKAYRETKSKTVQEAIQISAVNAKGASLYGSNSTGERNRINLAVTLGLIEYFRDMGVFESDLLVCDEIFDGLDSTGVEQGLLALRKAAIPTVLVVSHHDHLKPLFADTTYVTKKNGVSSIGV